ncbi:hypothetical protein GCM10010995_21890 [Cysteiniphilum litorale]|uniref:Uncharacterized protein n=2 Tax=Fastidiosibacteraceae TaxID=2056687 RepID=A0A8J2Z692_9GAMM|nr:hypothetical protein GCM10010995_21890 [Cysteiniphilum litorale]
MELAKSNLTMSSREIAELCDKEHKQVMRDIRAMLEQLKQGTDLYLGQYESNNRKYDEYNLPKRESLILVSGYSITMRAKIIDRWQELEAKGQSSLPNFNNPAEAARAWALQYEQNKQLEYERNEAVHTKAWISDKKTATAMNTASQMVKKVDKLEDELGRGKNYKAVKAIPWLLDYFINTHTMYSVVGRKLSLLTNQMGYSHQEVEHEQYGTVKAYHIDVIEAFKHDLDDDLNHLGKFRK